MSFLNIYMKRFLIFLILLLSLSKLSYSQNFTDSNLPIVLITTDKGIEIRDSPRVLANMKIIYRGDGSRNFIIDQNTPGYLNYNGRISIEIRGSSSQFLSKKQYGLTTIMADNILNNNVSLLGLPKENDWILNGLGFDPSLIRDYINYNLSRMIGEYASRTIFCEVMINGNYNGLYLLQEKIKAGTDRVDVTKIDIGDNSFPSITGGFITKADKLTGNDPIAWSMASYVAIPAVTFIHDHPKPEYVTKAQNNYIHSEFEKLRIAASTGNVTYENGFPSVIDIPSFVDFMIINELSANADAYQFSTFFHKDRNGKLRAGPIWDTNLTFGNDLTIWGFDRSKTNTWQFSNGDNEGPEFWKDLFNNPEFRCYLSKRWNQLIKPGQPLNISSLEALIDKTVSTISEAVVRENIKWSTVPFHSNEILKIKSFLKQRIDWMTSAIGPYLNCSNPGTPPLVITKIMYNPDSTLNFPDSKDQEFIEIKNTGNTAVNLTGIYFSGTGFVYQFPVYSQVLPNSFKILAGNAEVFRSKYGFPPAGQFTRNLSNDGENLVLADGFGNVIDSVSYSNLPPWPSADGNGYFLELTDPLSDNSIASNWKASYSTLVSVEDVELTLELNLYPMPVKDYLTIESSARIFSIQLFDFQGKILRKIRIDSEIYYLDMASYPTGFYLLEIFTPEGSSVRKIIKE